MSLRTEQPTPAAKMVHRHALPCLPSLSPCTLPSQTTGSCPGFPYSPYKPSLDASNGILTSPCTSQRSQISLFSSLCQIELFQSLKLTVTPYFITLPWLPSACTAEPKLLSEDYPSAMQVHWHPAHMPYSNPLLLDPFPSHQPCDLHKKSVGSLVLHLLGTLS